jgi:hypothetical protein
MADTENDGLIRPWGDTRGMKPLLHVVVQGARPGHAPTTPPSEPDDEPDWRPGYLAARFPPDDKEKPE